MLTDTHCHLFYDDIKNDLPNVLKRAEDLGVDRFICVATNVEDAKECLDLTKAYDNIYGSAGVHPHDSKDAPEDYVDRIYDLMESDSMVAVGEMGLDYFRNLSDPQIQKDVFRTQMSISKELNKPVILFPGSSNQIDKYADAILFTSLLSGRNPKYLIDEQVKGAKLIKNS